MDAWQDIRQKALTGSFNQLGNAMLKLYRAAYPANPALTLLLPYNTRGKPLVSSDNFTRRALRDAEVSMGLPSEPIEREYTKALLTEATQQCHDMVASTALKSGHRGGYHYSKIDLPYMETGPRHHELGLEVISIRVDAPLSLHGSGFAKAAQKDPDRAYREAYEMVHTVGHEIYHGISRQKNNFSSRHATPFPFNVEEVGAQVFGAYCAAKAFGPSMAWQMRRLAGCPGADYRYFAPKTYRAAALDLTAMFEHPPRSKKHFNNRSLNDLFVRAGEFALRQHVSFAQLQEDTIQTPVLAVFEQKFKTDTKSRSERLDQARKGQAREVYGAFYPVAYVNDHMREVGDKKSADYRRRMNEHNPLRAAKIG